MGFDTCCSVCLATQPLLRVFGQQLCEQKQKCIIKLFLFLLVSLYRHLSHHSTDCLGVLCKLVIVLLLFLLHPPLHLLPLHSFFAGTEGRSSSSHLVNETTQSPPIWTHAVLFIVYHLRSCRERETGCYG